MFSFGKRPVRDWKTGEIKKDTMKSVRSDDTSSKQMTHNGGT